MRCYIKSFRDFSLLGVHEVQKYELADGDKGSVTILAQAAAQLTTQYVGVWTLLDNELYYISGAKPNDTSLVLEVLHPIYAFSRLIPFTGETTFGALIQRGITDGYINGGGDTLYEQPYISITSTDTTAFTAEVDDYGYYSVSKSMEKARKNGVEVSFKVAGERSQRLEISVKTKVYPTVNIVFGDGHHHLASESYDSNLTAKVTVAQALDGDSVVLHDFYLSEDHHISTEPPANRLYGKWNVYQANADEDPLAVARGALSGNRADHKIEFYSDKRYELNQPINLRLRDEVFSTEITARIDSSTDDRYFYRCGDLKNTITERVQELSSAEHVRSINGKVGNVIITATEIGALQREEMNAVELTTADGLVNVNGSCVAVYYRSSNIVTVSINAKPNVADTWVTIFTLPVGFRPPFNISTSAGTTEYLIRAQDGAFRIRSSSTTVNTQTLITFGV